MVGSINEPSPAKHTINSKSPPCSRANTVQIRWDNVFKIWLRYNITVGDTGFKTESFCAPNQVLNSHF